MSNLQVEVNKDFVEANTQINFGGVSLSITPPLNEDYWLFRVKLHEEQAMLGFPKHATVGIGFAQEEDWNTNLPYTCDAQQILGHIRHNKKYEQITDADCLEAIQLIQAAIRELE